MSFTTPTAATTATTITAAATSAALTTTTAASASASAATATAATTAPTLSQKEQISARINALSILWRDLNAIQSAPANKLTKEISKLPLTEEQRRQLTNFNLSVFKTDLKAQHLLKEYGSEDALKTKIKDAEAALEKELTTIQNPTEKRACQLELLKNAIQNQRSEVLDSLKKENFVLMKSDPNAVSMFGDATKLSLATSIKVWMLLEQSLKQSCSWERRNLVEKALLEDNAAGELILRSYPLYEKRHILDIFKIAVTKSDTLAKLVMEQAITAVQQNKVVTYYSTDIRDGLLESMYIILLTNYKFELAAQFKKQTKVNIDSSESHPMQTAIQEGDTTLFNGCLKAKEYQTFHLTWAISRKSPFSEQLAKVIDVNECLKNASGTIPVEEYIKHGASIDKLTNKELAVVFSRYGYDEPLKLLNLIPPQRMDFLLEKVPPSYRLDHNGEYIKVILQKIGNHPRRNEILNHLLKTILTPFASSDPRPTAEMVIAAGADDTIAIDAFDRFIDNYYTSEKHIQYILQQIIGEKGGETTFAYSSFKFVSPNDFHDDGEFLPTINFLCTLMEKEGVNKLFYARLTEKCTYNVPHKASIYKCIVELLDSKGRPDQNLLFRVQTFLQQNTFFKGERRLASAGFGQNNSFDRLLRSNSAATGNWG